jgi:hypothetical protein
MDKTKEKEIEEVKGLIDEITKISNNAFNKLEEEIKTKEILAFLGWEMCGILQYFIDITDDPVDPDEIYLLAKEKENVMKELIHRWARENREPTQCLDGNITLN